MEELVVVMFLTSGALIEVVWDDVPEGVTDF